MIDCCEYDREKNILSKNFRTANATVNLEKLI